MTTTALRAARTIDARDSLCPGPLLELIRAVRSGAVGDVIAVWSSDPASRSDIPIWATHAGHRVVGVHRRADYDEIVIEKRR